MPPLKFLRLCALNVILGLILLECGLQAVQHFGNDTLPVSKALRQLLQPPQTWQENFLRSYMENGTLVYAGIHQPHPTRGWAMKPSAHVTLPPDSHYTTNAQGYRALHDFADNAEQYEVLIVGDSFTFGDQIDDQYTWPHLLEQNDSRLNVLNLGGSGYGTDQMLITLQEEISHYHPKLVIAAFIGDDLLRASLPFRDYQKPYMTLDAAGQLQTRNTPVGGLADVIAEISRQPSFPRSSLETVNLWQNLRSPLNRINQHADCDAACNKLNIAILEAMQKTANAHGAEFLLVYLPYGKEIRKADISTFGETFFMQYRQQHAGYFLNTRTSFLAATFSKAKGHYQADENRLLTTLVQGSIRDTHSWQCFAKGDASC